jgi:MFS family permease
MLQAALKVRSLLFAILVMMIGSGYLSTFITLRLEESGVDALTIAAVTATYFAGLTLGSVRVPHIINRIGHIRAFAAFVSLFSATTLFYALLPAPYLWIALRFLDGVCMAAVFVCLESWLNDRVEDQRRGTTLAAYMIALYFGQAIGQQLLNLAPDAPALPFVIASIPISLAVIPVALTRLGGPTVSEQLPIPIARLYAASPLGFVGAVTSGIMLGAFYGLGAVYARRLGLSLADTAALMSLVIIGGIALQWPLGRMSDRFERRRVVVATIAGCVAATGLLALPLAQTSLFLTAALFGGLSFSLYPLSVAHTNDHLAPSQRVAASGGLVLLYSVGAVLGPLLAGTAMRAFEPRGLFMLLCVCCGIALLFAFWRQVMRAPVPSVRQQPYRTLPRTTPVAMALEDSAGRRSVRRNGESI